MNLEPSIRVILGSLGVVVDHRHGNVTQIHVRHVDIGILVAHALGYTL